MPHALFAATTRCPDCPNKHEYRRPPIHGSGPIPARVMIVGEGPGKTEDRRRKPDGTGTPFIGDSGTELDNLYLPLCGLSRSQCYVTNAIRCLPPGKGTDNLPLAKCCAAQFLDTEIRRVKPRVLITLGAIAGKLFDPGLSLEHSHGIARPLDCVHGIVTWIPMYHPAAGMRDTNAMQALLDDFSHLRHHIHSYLQGLFVVDESRHDPYPRPDYRECPSPESVDSYFASCLYDLSNPDHPGYSPYAAARPLIALDTEYDDCGQNGLDPICVSFSLLPGTGRVIRVESADAMDRLGELVRSTYSRALLHNWFADAGILRQFGLSEALKGGHDTMAMAYHNGNLPQALKTLAYRLCGMQMTDFDDLVGPYWLTAVLEWAQEAARRLVPPGVALTPTDQLALLPGAIPPPDEGFYDPCGPGGAYENPARTDPGTKKPQKRSLYRMALEGGLFGDLSVLRGKTLGYTAASEEDARILAKVAEKAKTGQERLITNLTRMVKDIEAGTCDNPKDRWTGWSDESRAAICAAHGPMPRKSLRLVPWHEAIHYACRDSDATLRVFHKLMAVSNNVLRGVA